MKMPSNQDTLIEKWQVSLLPAQAYCASYRAEGNSVGFAFETQCGMHAFDSDRISDFWTRPNSLAFVPARCDVHSESDCGGEYLSFVIPKPYADDFQRTERFNDVVETGAVRAAYRLRSLLLQSASDDAGELEDCLLDLVQASQAVLGGTVSEASCAASMTNKRLKVLVELVEDELGSDLDVNVMAAELELSVGFLHRSFKAAMGQTPHAYVLERRIARARQQLKAHGSSLSAVAYECGFSSHAHMSSVFKARLGMTPSQYRRLFV